MAVRENITEDGLPILKKAGDASVTEDGLPILKKKESPVVSASSVTPSKLQSHLSEEQRAKEIDYLNSPQGNKLKPFSESTANAPSHVAKDVAEIEHKNHLAKVNLIDESVNNSPNLETAISKINNVDLNNVSEARAGQIIHNTLNDPDFQSKVNSDPKLEHEAAVVKNSLAITHPSFGLKQVEQKIGQHIQESGKNSLWYEHPDEASMDAAVDDMVSNGKMSQQERYLYMKNKGLVKDWVKYQSPALVQSLRRGVESGLTGLESTIRDVGNKVTGGALQSAGLLETDEARAKRQTAEQDATPQIEPTTGAGKAIKGIGEFTGFVVPLILTTALTKGAGVTGQAAEAIPMIAQFEGVNADRSRQLFPDDTKRQLAYTALATTIDASLGTWLPTGKAAANIGAILKKDIAETAEKMTGDIAKDEVLKNSLLNRVKSFVGETAKGSASTANAVAGFQILHNGLDAAFGKRDFDLENEAKDAFETWKSAFVSGLPLGGLGAMNKLMSSKLKGRITADVAENPEQSIQNIEDQAKLNPELEPLKNEAVAKIKDISKAWGVIKEELPNHTEAQKEKFLVKDIEQKDLDKKASEANIDVVKEDLQNKANDAYADKVKIYNGTDTAPEHQEHQPKLKTPDEIEPELQNQLGQEKAKQAAKEVNDIAEHDLFPEGLQTWEKESAKQYPLQFLKEVSDQLHTVDTVEEGKTASPKEAAQNKYGEDIVQLAEEYFPNNKTEQNAIQEQSASGVLQHPQGGAGEAGGERGRMESGIQGEEVAGAFQKEKEGGGEPPSNEPVVGVNPEETVGGITHAAMEERRKRLDMEEYEGKPTQTHPELIEYAKQAIAKGYDVEKLMRKIERGHIPKNTENAILSEYQSALDYQLENNPTKEIFEKATRLATILDPAGSAAGKALESRKLLSAKEDNLTNFLIDKKMAQGHELTEGQIKEQAEKFKEKKTVERDYTESLKKDVAQAAVDEIKKEKKKSTPKSHEDYVKQREDLKKKLLEQRDAHIEYMKQQGIQKQGFGFTLTTDMIKTIGEIVKSHVDETAQKLEQIVEKVFEDIKDIFPEATKSDILDVISGKYKQEREQPTRNEILANQRLLEREAKLLGQLSDERKGLEKEKKESKKIEKNRRIEELENKIKEVRETNKQRKLEDEGVSEQSTFKKDATPDEKLQARLKKQIKNLEIQLKNKDYAVEKKEAVPIKLSPETIKLKDKLIDLERQRNNEIAKDEYSKRSTWQKAYDKFIQFAGIRRIVQSAVDLSVSFRQGATLMSPRQIGVWVKSFGNQLKSVFSQKNYDRIMHDIRHSEPYHDMVEDGITFNDLESIKPEQRNEDFQQSFVYKIPLVKEPLLASNRAADGFLNTARYELYMKMRRNLERQGITRQSDPKAYKAAARWTMNMTGRGNLLEMLEHDKAQQVLGNTFYGARLMASRFNMLNPATYIRMPKEMRLEALKDIGAWATTVIASGYALSKAGATVSTNPDDSDFLQARFGDKVYDMSGGLAIYLRTYARLVHAAYTKATGTKYEGNKATEKSGQSAIKFLRNKLAPNTGYFADAYFGKSGGQPFDPYEIVEIYPMYVDDVKKALKDDGGVTGLATVLLPNLLGVGYGNYAARGTIDKDLDVLLERNLRSDEGNKELIKNYKDGGREITTKEFNEYADKRDEVIKKSIEKLYKEGALVVENHEVVKKPYSELTREQVVKETSSIKSQATKEVREEMFGKREKTREEKRDEKKLKKAKDKEE